MVIPDRPYNPETWVITDQTYIPEQAYNLTRVLPEWGIIIPQHKKPLQAAMSGK
jgi:hypothetical protein